MLAPGGLGCCPFPGDDFVVACPLFVVAPMNSDSGNGNHSVSLPIVLIKIKVDQMLPSSYISSLLVSIL